MNSLIKILKFLGISRSSFGLYQRNKNRNMKSCYEHLKSLNFYPKTIIDVGVASGTPELSSTFPKSFFYLIEPLSHFKNANMNFLKTHTGELVSAAAGKISGNTQINVHDDHLEGSSILQEAMGEKADGHKEFVKIITLDSIFVDKKLETPTLLKIDVQGTELDVLRGFKKHIKLVDVIVLEASAFKFMKGSPEIYDIISFMKNYEFVVYDIVIGWYRPLDNALGQIDIFFVKENGKFRKSHDYSN